MPFPVLSAAAEAAATSAWAWIAIAALLAIVVLIGLLQGARRQHLVELAEVENAARQDRETAKRETEALARDSRTKSELLSSLTWEVRANLNGIIGSADLLLDSTTGARQREQLGALRSSAEALHQSLNDVIDYATIESGRIRIAREAFDLRDPLIGAIEQLLPLATLKGLELVLVIAPEVPVLVTGDSAHLRQILLNLTSNAVKFTSSGRVVLRAELPHGSGSMTPTDSGWLNFTVSDTGSGVPEEMHASLFERATPPETADPHRSGRAGLGLAICKRLVELMGGKIGARNTVDGGTDFWVMLPLPADPNQPAPVSVPDIHVVVLDDQAVTRVATSMMLMRSGIEHDATDTVEYAMELLREAREEGAATPVLLVDESVARSKDRDLLEALRANVAKVSPRIVIMARDPDSLPGFHIPYSGVARKPLLREESVLHVLTGTEFVGDSRAPFAVPVGQESTRPASPRILVVDDDEVSRFVSSQLLARLGCTVELASSGPESIRMATTKSYALVVMDCQMPGMDGFEATEKIREAKGAAAPPIIALTANTTNENRARCFAAGMCDFIDKPVRRAELARILKRWVQPAAESAAPNA